MANRETDTRKTIMSNQIEESAHSALISIVNKTGKPIAFVIAEMLDWWIVECAKTNRDRNVQAHAAHIKTRERQTQRTILKQVAVAYQSEPTEEALDEFKDLCDALGVSMEKVIEEMNELPHIAEVLKGTESISKAEMWILENMKPDKPIASKKIEEMGYKAGYKKHILRDAKDRLNAVGNIQIRSMKQGTMWFWSLTIPESQ